MIHLEHLVDKYCEGWSAESAAERERLIRETLADGAIYTDPRASRLGILELLDHIAKVHALRPGAKVLRTSQIDTHHGFARFHWRVVMPDGSSLPESIDVIELNASGTRIERVIGFFGAVQPLADLA